MPRRIGELTETGIIAEMRAELRRLWRAVGSNQAPDGEYDKFTLASSSDSAHTLTYIPSLSLIPIACLNGLAGDYGTDYTVDFSTGIVTWSATKVAGDVLSVFYQTTGDLVALSGPVDLGAISDGFTGPSNQHLSGRATSDGRANWVVPLGDFLTNNPGVESVAFQSIGYIETSATDGTVQCDVTPDSLGAYYAVMVRYVDNNNYWYFEAKNVASTGRVVHNAGGAPTVVASGLAVGGAGPFTMKVVMSGTSLQFYNGATLLYTDTGGALSTATKHGIWAGNNGVANLFANWSWTP